MTPRSQATPRPPLGLRAGGGAVAGHPERRTASMSTRSALDRSPERNNRVAGWAGAGGSDRVSGGTAGADQGDARVAVEVRSRGTPVDDAWPWSGTAHRDPRGQRDVAGGAAHQHFMGSSRTCSAGKSRRRQHRHGTLNASSMGGSGGPKTFDTFRATFGSRPPHRRERPADAVTSTSRLWLDGLRRGSMSGWCRRGRSRSAPWCRWRCRTRPHPGTCSRPPP